MYDLAFHVTIHIFYLSYKFGWYAIVVNASSLHKISPSRLSNAFSKSIKFTERKLFHLIDCSIIIHTVAIWSRHDLSLLNHACRSRRFLSTVVLIRCRTTTYK